MYNKYVNIVSIIIIVFNIIYVYTNISSIVIKYMIDKVFKYIYM